MSNGEINIRETHPAMYRVVMSIAAGYVLLGANFVFLHPAFLIYDRPNWLWGTIFIALGIAKFVFLNVYRRVQLVRLCMMLSVIYMVPLTYGTSEPFRDGMGSLQLPIVYALIAAVQISVLVEPFVNPMTAKR